MLRQDKVWVGILFGLLFPVIIFALIYEINLALTTVNLNWLKNVLNPRVLAEFQMHGGFQPKFIAILSVCCNLIPFNVFKRAGKDHALQGVLTATFILVIILVIVFWDQFLGA